MIMHPTNPSLDGQHLTHHKDLNGLQVFVKMAEICSRRGEGLVAYMWVKPGTIEPVPKTSFVKLYKPWD